MTVVKEPDQNTTQNISKQCIYLRYTRACLLVNMKYVICVFYQGHSQSPSQPSFGMSRNAPPKETAAHIRTTFLSRFEPITAAVPFSGTGSREIF